MIDHLLLTGDLSSLKVLNMPMRGFDRTANHGIEQHSGRSGIVII